MTTQEELDENLIDENINEEEIENDETDYKELYESEKLKSEKFEKNFKSIAKKYNDSKKNTGNQDTSDVGEIVSKKVQEELYYANNPVAKEYKSEIQEIQSKHGFTPEDAMTFYLAKNKPELIGKQGSNTGVDGISKSIDPKKDYKEMTEEELRDAKG